MPHIPPNRHWYIAEIVMQFDIEDEADTLVHIDTRLVRGDSPDEALRKAEQFGRDGETEYHNTGQKRVRVKYRGLQDLFLIYDELEDGAELLYEERSGLTEDEIKALLKEKATLAVFR